MVTHPIRQRGEIRRLVKRLEEGLELGGDVVELGPEEVKALHQSGHFTHGGFMPMRRRHRPPGFLPDLLNLEAPHPPSAPVRLHDSEKGGLRQLGDSCGGRASPQHGEAPRRRHRLPLANDFRERAVELMHQQRLESCALTAQAMVLTPRPPQLHVLRGQELALGDDPRASNWAISSASVRSRLSRPICRPRARGRSRAD